MSNQLQGKIYWVKDDFKYLNTVVSKKGSTTHTVAKIENVTIDENMIKFFVCPHTYKDNDQWTYNVNLVRNEVGTTYSGSFSEGSEPSHKGIISCDLFSNEKNYLIQGSWEEEGNSYTFWANIKK